MFSLSFCSTIPTMNTINVRSPYRQNTPSSLISRASAQSRKTLFQKRSQKLSCALSRLTAAGVDSEENDLPEGLKVELIPKHVAVIMDGNRRWARERNLPIEFGHKAGGEVMKQLIHNCAKFGVKVFTVFAFSTENWVRSEEEIKFLMSLYEEIVREVSDLQNRHDLQISVIGDRTRLPESLQSVISSAGVSSKANTGLRIVGALNYSGRYDITEASKKIATKVRDGDLRVEDINEDLFERHLETNEFKYSNPDLLIRTSGEQRISNFMLWQLAYSELYFSKKLFPDFGEDDFIDALKSFQQRQRRYGGHKYPDQE